MSNESFSQMNLFCIALDWDAMQNKREGQPTTVFQREIDISSGLGCGNSLVHVGRELLWRDLFQEQLIEIGEQGRGRLRR